MERREFLKLVLTATAAYSVSPLEKAFTAVSQSTGYKDDLILRMYESGEHVVIETRRRVTVRECFELKHEWEKSIGLFRGDNPFDYDKRDVYIRPMSKDLPPSAEFLCDVEDAWTANKTGEKRYEVKYADGQGGGSVQMDEVMVHVCMPDAGPSEPWTSDYRVIDEYSGSGPTKFISAGKYMGYRLGPGGSSAILGVYDEFEEWLWTIGTNIKGTLDLGIELSHQDEFVTYLKECGIEYAELGERIV